MIILVYENVIFLFFGILKLGFRQNNNEHLFIKKIISAEGEIRTHVVQSTNGLLGLDNDQ